MPEEVPEWGVQIHRGLYDSLRSKLGMVFLLSIQERQIISEFKFLI